MSSTERPLPWGDSPSLRLLALVAAVACGPGACGPQNAQYLVHIDTDAPLAVEPGGVLAPGDPKPLFDQLMITMYGGAYGCVTDCTRVFAVDRSMFSGDQMPTFGIYSPDIAYGGSFSVQLYRAAGAAASGPSYQASIGGLVFLSEQKPQAQPQDIYIQLRVADIGYQTCTTAGCSTKDVPTFSSAQPKLPAWKPAYPTPCAGKARQGEVCVPAGSFWLGNMLDVNYSYQKVAAVSPFYLDADEVTVADFRASGLAVVDVKTGLSADPIDHGGASAGASSCTFSIQSAGAGPDGLALNCVTWKQARAYCQSQGKDLPTWLQFEYVAGARTSQLYPWGRDEPGCQDAVFGRSGATTGGQSSQCTEADTPSSPLAPRSGRRDRVDLPGGSIYDLGGNVAEWVQDYAGAGNRPCSSSSLLIDFVCNDPAPSMGLRVVKGGAWFSQASAMRAPSVSQVDPTQSGIAIGFRCARAMAP